MHITPTQTLKATGTSAPALHTPSPGPVPDSSASVVIGGAFSGSTVVNVDGQQMGSSVWVPLAMTDRKSLNVNSGSASLADNTPSSFLIDVRGIKQIRIYPSAGTVSGGLTVDVVSGTQDEMGGPIALVS